MPKNIHHLTILSDSNKTSSTPGDQTSTSNSSSPSAVNPPSNSTATSQQTNSNDSDKTDSKKVTIQGESPSLVEHIY